MQKEKVSRQKKKNEEKTVDPDKPKRPSSSFLLFNNCTITALISLKWKVFLICADEEGLISSSVKLQ